MLLPELECAMGGIVTHLCPQRLKIGEHAWETSAGADALLALYDVRTNTSFPMQFLPSTQTCDVEFTLYSGRRYVMKIQGRMYTQITQFLRIPPTHSPDVSNWENLQRLQALLIGVYQTALIVCRISLGIFRCHLGQCPCGSNAYAHWHAHPLTDSFGQVFTPTFQVLLLHAVEQQEGLIDGVNLNRWSCLTQDFHDPAGHVPIQCIVTGQCLYLHAWKKFSQLILSTTTGLPSSPGLKTLSQET